MFGIYHDITISADNRSIMRAISTPAGFNKWWTLECDGMLLEGAVFNFKFSDAYNWYATLDSYVIDQSIVYLMTRADKDWVDTTLHFDIIPYSEDKKILRFEHQGWRIINEHFRRTSYCWAQYLSNLKKYLESGTVIPFGQRTDF